MKKNIKNIAVIAVLIMVLFSAIIVVYAYLSSIDKVQNTFKPAVVSCKVNEVREGNEKKSVTVENTSNVGVYLRVVAVTYWQDSRGSVVGKPSVDLGLDVKFNSEDWVKGENNTFYYKKVVKSGDSTSDLLTDSSKIELGIETRKEEVVGGDDIVFEYYQVVEFIAEAIQAAPEEAVKNSWGVTITDGKITSVN